MGRHIAFLLGAASLALAADATTTISIIFPGDAQTLVGSVVAVDSHAVTTVKINCPTGEDSSDCGVAPGIEVTQGPSTWAWTLTASGSPDGDM